MKFPLTTEGIKAIQQLLLSEGEESLQAAASDLISDPIAWLANHFELQVAQLEYLRSLPQISLLVLSSALVMAIAVSCAVVIKDHLSTIASGNNVPELGVLCDIAFRQSGTGHEAMHRGNLTLSLARTPANGTGAP